MTQRSLLLRTLASAIVLAAGILVPEQAALAGPACSGDGCDGLSATATHCDVGKYAVGGLKVTSQTGTGTGELDLFYSPSCQAVWGDYTKNTNPDVGGNLTLSSQPEYGGVGQVVQEMTVEAADSDYQTTMVGWRHSINFCLNPGTCTGWR